MDKVLSARVDEAVLRRLGMLARALGTTKKDVLQRAILTFSERVEMEQDIDVFRQTCGAWHRDESPEETAQKARLTFRQGLERHLR
ncbi:MAG: hypothetical protein SCH98_10090 [Deferrisomatales bacterium]|nr:hypothetical protein [Deferrisomatales bacterium]